jgi:DNA-binding response OmpR family regulator
VDETMRILLVEDDKDTSSLIRDGLKDRYIVECVFNGEDAISLAEANSYDLYILDIGLPDSNGIDICRRIRLLDKEAPILMLTASTDIQDKVTVLDGGADDFLSKPFHFEELQARLRALMRRGKSLPETNILQAGDVKIDLAQGHAFHKEMRLNLRRKEFLLLEYFLRHAGRVITRNMLLEHVWESKSDPLTNTVDVHVKFLRDKIDKPFGTHHILTIHGMGYKFETVTQESLDG